MMLATSENLKDLIQEKIFSKLYIMHDLCKMSRKAKLIETENGFMLFLNRNLYFIYFIFRYLFIYFFYSVPSACMPTGLKRTSDFIIDGC